jgi:hypothetical protein
MSITSSRATILSLVALAWTAGCRPPASSWQAFAEQKGCTESLLATTARYDSSQVLELAGTYRLVQIDTARGWIDLRSEDGAPRDDVMLLWVPDSATRYSRVNSMSRERVTVDRPILGELKGYESTGFTSDYPQVEVTGRNHDWVIVVFDAKPMFDGAAWVFPIERRGSWGFGGYFIQGSYVVPVGPDGKALAQRAGFYCAFRTE